LTCPWLQRVSTLPRVALKQADGTLGYFRDVSWTDRVPVMYQTLLVDSFDHSGRLPAVGRENVGLRADYLLKTDLASFEADYTSGKPPLGAGLAAGQADRHAPAHHCRQSGFCGGGQG
jgi:ABC-type uncharacterized transport system auxiliary subunit